MSVFPAPVAPKLRLGIVVNLGGRLSHEFAIFAKQFCIELINTFSLKSIFVNNLNLAIVRIPQIYNIHMTEKFRKFSNFLTVNPNRDGQTRTECAQGDRYYSSI